MTDDFVDRRAAGFWEVVVVERRRVAVPRCTSLNRQSVLSIKTATRTSRRQDFKYLHLVGLQFRRTILLDRSDMTVRLPASQYFFLKANWSCIVPQQGASFQCRDAYIIYQQLLLNKSYWTRCDCRNAKCQSGPMTELLTHVTCHVLMFAILHYQQSDAW